MLLLFVMAKSPILHSRSSWISCLVDFFVNSDDPTITPTHFCPGIAL